MAIAARASSWVSKCTSASPVAFPLELYSMVIRTGFSGAKNYVEKRHQKASICPATMLSCCPSWLPCTLYSQQAAVSQPPALLPLLLEVKTPGCAPSQVQQCCMHHSPNVNCKQKAGPENIVRLCDIPGVQTHTHCKVKTLHVPNHDTLKPNRTTSVHL